MLAIHAETAVKQNRGLLSLVDELVVPALPQLPPAQRAPVEQARSRARDAVSMHQQWLERELLPNANGDFRIGRELFDQAQLRADVAAVARRDPRPRRSRGAATRARDVRARARCSPGARRRRAPAKSDLAQQQAAIEAALELASAERPARRRGRTARETLKGETTEFVRRDGFVTLPDEPLRSS